jgi:hypothetical protein
MVSCSQDLLAGLEVAENEDVARFEPDRLALADIVHEFDLGGGAFHVLHQRGRHQGCRNASGKLGRSSENRNPGGEERWKRH